MKKIITITLSIVLVLTFLAGCGADKRALYNVDLKDYIKVDNYKGIEIDSDSDEYKKQYNSFIASDVQGAQVYDDLKEGKVQKGDTANIDFVGKKDGVAFDGGTAKGYELEIGSNSFIPGFEDGLIGVEIGTTVDLDLKFPENYGKEDLNGAAVVFTVTVNSVKRKVDLYDTYNEGTVQNGDVANIDYVGKKDGVAFEGGTDSGHDLTIGSNSFIPGFEDGLVGVAVGSTVDLNLKFPEDYGKEDLNGAAVVFTVTVNSVKRPKAPEEIYKHLGFKTLKVYEMDLKKRVCNAIIMDKLADKAKVIKYSDDDLDALYNMQTKVIEAQIASSGYNVSVEEYVANAYGMSMADYKSEIIKTLKPVSKEQMIFYYIFDKEEMEITEEEKSAKAKEIFEGDTSVPQEVKDIYSEYGVIEEKVTEFLYKNAKIK